MPARKTPPPRARLDSPQDPAKRETLKRLAAFGLVAMGADLSLSTPPSLGASARPKPTSSLALGAGANLVICVLDAARRDHFGCYGYPRQTTPNADLLARESFLFTNHFCQDTHTPGSVASLFTGQYPDTHLAYGYRPISPNTPTIARLLEQADFRTALFSSNAWASPLGNKGVEFQDKHSTKDALAVAKAGEQWYSPGPLLRLFEQWLAKHAGERFFCYLHFVPPHQPYPKDQPTLAPFSGQQPPGYRPENYHPGKWDLPIRIVEPHPPLPEWINLYDANLRQADWAAGQVMRLLREAGVFDKTVFVLTSDHGEAFGEHGLVFHNGCPYDEVAHIPLLVRLPRGGRAGRVTSLTQTIDLFPTMCELFGIQPPPGTIQGRSFLPLLTGAKARVNDHVFTHSNTDRDKYMVRDATHSLLLCGTNNYRALYDLKADPGQRRNVISANPRKAKELTEVFRSYAKRQRWNIMYIIDPSVPYAERPRDLPGRTVSPETQRQLKALGYLK